MICENLFIPYFYPSSTCPVIFLPDQNIRCAHKPVQLWSIRCYPQR